MDDLVRAIDLPVEATVGAVDVDRAAIRLTGRDPGERRGPDHTTAEFQEEPHIILGLDLDRLIVAVSNGPQCGEPGINLDDPAVGDVFG